MIRSTKTDSNKDAFIITKTMVWGFIGTLFTIILGGSVYHFEYRNSVQDTGIANNQSQIKESQKFWHDSTKELSGVILKNTVAIGKLEATINAKN